MKPSKLTSFVPGTRGLPPIRRRDFVSWAGRGFTLVELLVVIGIIALLAAILMAAASSALTSGRATVSMSNLHQLAEANIAYTGDHDGYYCPAANDNTFSILWCAARTGSSISYDPTQGYLSPYLGQNGQIMTCPLFTNMTRVSSAFAMTGGYGYNDIYIGGSAGTNQPVKAVNVPRPAMTVMFTTTAWLLAGATQEYPFSRPPSWVPASVDFRDRGRALAAWCDGHVSAELPSQIYSGGSGNQTTLGSFGPTANNGYWNPAYTGP